MSRFILQVRARFVGKADGGPVGGPGCIARVFDRDAIADDFLGEAVPDADGRVSVFCDSLAAASLDSWLETRPDLYIVLLKDDREMARSRVMRDADIARANPVTGHHDSLTVDLGTVEVGAP